ncbi:uncharacterized protein METZ01_LOCUS414926 [marine metagenome]|uniref:50S ribosomal protein L29 n=1 Tax=marine metagenome TaxID=408172 RepID=A0A382WTE0_9ZZZZ
MAKKSFLSKLRRDSSLVMDEEQRLKKELMDLRIKQSSGQLKEIHKIKETKRAIAQLKTVSNEKSEEKKT